MKTGSLRRILGYTFRYKWSFLISVVGFIIFAAADIAAVDWIRRIIKFINAEDESSSYIIGIVSNFYCYGQRNRLLYW